MTKEKVSHNAKRLARLAAVQGLYQIVLTGQSAAKIIGELRQNPANLLGEAVDPSVLPVLDKELMTQIIQGVTDNQSDLDGILSGALDARFSMDRIEVLLGAVLRAGVFELCHHGSVAPSVIINDYVDVAHAYFNAKEPGLVNAVLDKIAKKMR